MASAKKPSTPAAKKAAAPAVKKAAAPAAKKAAAPVAKKAVAPAVQKKATAPAKKAAAPAPAKKAAAPAKKAATPAKKAVAPVAKKAVAPAVQKKAAAPVSAKKAAPAPAPKKAAAPAKPAPVVTATPEKVSKPTPPAPTKKAASKAAEAGSQVVTLPPVKGVTKDGISFTKDFDGKFLTQMRDRLLEERELLTGQAIRLEDEANSLIEEAEMGDVQFDEEGGEGDTMVVERERDLALSAQNRQTIADIDLALERLKVGTYGYSDQSGRLIPRERLDAIPWTTVLVEEKVGGLGRR